MNLSDAGGALCNTKQSAELLFGDFTETTKMRLYRMIDRREINAQMIGKRWYIQRTEIERIAGTLPT